MIPVILIHSGYQDYLNYSLNKALEKNEVYLIGDVNPNIQNDKFNFFHLQNYINDEFRQFTSLYEHLSTNPYQFELFCFLRWFIVKEFMTKEKIDTCFYIDSDVMLYVDVNDEFKKFEQYDFTVLHRTAAVSSFITKRGIENFCSLLMKTYSNKNTYQYQKIKSHFTIRQQYGLGGGVCDMTLLEVFHYNADDGGGPGRVGEMMSILDDSTYDHNINVSDQDFDFKNGIKNIQMIEGIPYVFSNKLNKLIKFNSIHFNSGAKVLMQKYS
jgi:hypothetical protein